MAKNSVAYPPLPEKQFFTIGEAAALSRTKPHTVRYWEREIPALAKVARRRGGRRYYSVDDVELLRRVSGLIQKGGYTIAGAAAVVGSGKRGRVSEAQDAADMAAQSSDTAAGLSAPALRKQIEDIMAILG